MGFNHPGFDYRTRPETGRGAPCVVCDKCGTVEFLPYNGATPPPPVMQKKAAELGWTQKSRSKWLCPKHSTRGAKNNDTDELLRGYASGGVVAPPPLPAPANGQTDLERLTAIVADAMEQAAKMNRAGPKPVSAAAVARGLIKFAKGDARSPHTVEVPGAARTTVYRWAQRLGVDWNTPLDFTKTKLTEEGMEAAKQTHKPAEKVVPIRALTPAQTAKVAVKLDAVFDADKGKYLDGWSDQKIAEELDVPRANVTAFRDEAFGPIKSDPLLDKALEILARLENEHAQVKAAHDALAIRLKRIEEGMREATDRITRAAG